MNGFRLASRSLDMLAPFPVADTFQLLRGASLERKLAVATPCFCKHQTPSREPFQGEDLRRWFLGLAFFQKADEQGSTSTNVGVPRIEYF